MVAVPLGQSTYRRRGARTAEVAFTNCILEKDPTNQIDGLVRYQRPALSLFANVGTGPIRQVFRKDGVLGGNYLVVSGQSLYSVTTAGVVTELGVIPGSDICVIDGLSARAIVVAAGTAYSTDGVSVTPVIMPDGEAISSVVAIAGYFILTVEASQHAFWLAPGDVNPDALSFFSAEAAPDNLVRGARLLDELWLYGVQTTEIFQITGNIDLPFQPIGGRLYEQGCANKDTVFTLDNTLFWVGTDLKAYRADTAPVRISDHSMEERFREAGSDNLVGWAIAIDGHTMYVVRTGDLGTFVFDVENPDWGRWKSYGQETWRALVGAQVTGDVVIAGDDTNGILWKLDSYASNDNGQPLERELTGGIGIVGSPTKCKSFSVRVAVGWSEITGTATNPLLQLRFSDDGGNIWSSWIEMPLGYQGQYLTEVVWRQLGLMNEPGRLFTIRMTDDAIFRISYARMNDAVSI